MKTNIFTTRLIKIVSDSVTLPASLTGDIPLTFSFSNAHEFKQVQKPISIYSYMFKIPQLRGPNIISNQNFNIKLQDSTNPAPSGTIFQANKNLIPFFGYEVPFEMFSIKQGTSAPTDRLLLTIADINLVLDGLNLQDDYQNADINLEAYFKVRIPFTEGD